MSTLPVDALLSDLVNQTNAAHPERPPRLMVRGFVVIETHDGTEGHITLHVTRGLRGWEFSGLHTWVSDQADAVEAGCGRYSDDAVLDLDD
jgi:hypothetical protein